MMYAKDLKRIVNQLPDDWIVSLGGSDCNIEGFKYEDGVADLKLSDGYGIVRNDFIDSMFLSLRNAIR